SRRPARARRIHTRDRTVASHHPEKGTLSPQARRAEPPDASHPLLHRRSQSGRLQPFAVVVIAAQPDEELRLPRRRENALAVLDRDDTVGARMHDHDRAADLTNLLE